MHSNVCQARIIVRFAGNRGGCLCRSHARRKARHSRLARRACPFRATAGVVVLGVGSSKGGAQSAQLPRLCPAAVVHRRQQDRNGAMFDAAGSRGYILMLFVTHWHVQVWEARARPPRRASVRAQQSSCTICRAQAVVGRDREATLGHGDQR